jgi:hypothetical protein
MCAHAEHLETCPLCDNRTVFTKAQVAFLEDLLINSCCMTALAKEKISTEPENCRDCAENIVDVVERIRGLRD